MRTYTVSETVTREISEREALDIIADARLGPISPKHTLGTEVRVMKEDNVYNGYAGIVTNLTVPENGVAHSYIVSLLVDGRVIDVKMFASDLDTIEPGTLAA